MTRVRVSPPLPDVGGTVSVDAETSMHLLRVLRLRAGDGVVVFDGLGHEADAAVEVTEKVASLRLTSSHRIRRPPHDVHLLLAVLKGPAMDDAVRMATEAGLTHLHPVATSRSVPKGERSDRWERIVTSACEQCGRADSPVVSPIASLVEALAAVAHVPDKRVATPGGPRGAAATGPVVLLVGPEGGLSDVELAQAQAAGFQPIGLGPFVLRGMTAAAVAVASVWA